MNYEAYLKKCAEKTKKNIKEMGTGMYEYPIKNFSGGMYFPKDDMSKARPLSHIFCWTQGFYAGMAGLSYLTDKDTELLKWLNAVYGEFHDKVFKTPFETMHDLGFIYSPYAVLMYNATGDEKMKELGIKAADELLKRYIPNGHYIRAWGRMDDNIPDYVDEMLAKDHFFTKSHGLAIADCMMNLPLLFWAGEVTGYSIYTSVAVEHIETTLKNFIRPDGTVYHAFRFNEDGSPKCGENFCGFGVESYWSRGVSWVIYGLAIAYRYTKNQKYLDESIRLLADFSSRCDETGVPVWDFRLPEDEPARPRGINPAHTWDSKDAANLELAKDSSAAAVVVCAAQEILKHTNSDVAKDYKDRTLKALSEKYTNFSEENNGILTHSDGQMTYAIYGDYYYMQALVSEVLNEKTCW